MLSAAAVTLAVAAVWLVALSWRLPYLGQVPVFDADVTTTNAVLVARSWWLEGALNLAYSTPYAPLSVETPTIEARRLYQSWPPGAFVIVYWIALLLGVEPSVPLVNWINTCVNGLIALAVAFSGYHLCRLNRWPSLSASVIGIAASIPVLWPRGMAYIFSQIYCVTTVILLPAAAFILLEVLFHRAESDRQRKIISAAQLATIYVGFLIDWLAYTLFAFWMLSRLAGGFLGYVPLWRARTVALLALLPVSAFALFLGWRFLAPGSSARTEGIGASLYELGWKVLYRMNLTDAAPVSGFWGIFRGIHDHFLSPHVLPLIVVAVALSAILLILGLVRSGSQEEKRRQWITLAILFLCVVPFYVHMLIFYQHTSYHQWAIAKAIFAYGLVGFAILPIVVAPLLRIHGPRRLAPVGQPPIRFGSFGTVITLVVAVTALAGAAASATTNFHPYLMGRVAPDDYAMWKAIRDNTGYHDIVFSPVLQAAPIGVQVGVSHKLVHPASDFDQIDKFVSRVCAPFNVVIALPQGIEPNAFGIRSADEVVDTTFLRLLRFRDYPGGARDCPT